MDIAERPIPPGTMVRSGTAPRVPAGSEQNVHESPPPHLRVALVVAIALVLTVPFLAISPFPAVDFQSHAYNAWLSLLIERGDLPGLSVTPAWSNTLVDRVAAALLALLPLRAVEAFVLIVLAHLVVWSAFLFCRALAGRGCWESLPVLAAVGLGWSFHMGFTNWLASASLSMLAAAAMLSAVPAATRAAIALPAVGLAVVANPLPPAWVAVATMIVIAWRRPPHRPGLALAAMTILLAAVGLALHVSGRAIHTGTQWATFSGADQLFIFDAKYALFTIGLLALWASRIQPWLRSVGNRAVGDPAFAVAAFASGCCLLLPDAAFFPGYALNASFLVQRHSLFAAVAWTAVASLSGYSRRHLAAALLLLGSWLAVLAGDWVTLSRLAGNMADAVARLPPGSRVVSAIDTPRSRVRPLTHALDHACVHHCFSWGNYEPPSGHFRIRADENNLFVVSRVADYVAIEAGHYQVPDLPFPLWRVHPCDHSPPAVCTSVIAAGEVLRLECVDPFGRPWKRRGVERCAKDEEKDLHR